MPEARRAECNELLGDLDIEIARREGEPLWERRGLGFMEIRERDATRSVPCDGRNRLGQIKVRWAANLNYPDKSGNTSEYLGRRLTPC
jgi:hypothetical protein